MSYCTVSDLALMMQISHRFHSFAKFVINRVIEVIESTYYRVDTSRSNVRRLISLSSLHYLDHLVTPRIYILRGFISFSFDTRTRTWTRLPDLLRDRGYFRSVVLRNEIFAIGTFSMIAAGTIECYNPLYNQWTTGPMMPQRARSVGASIYRGSLFITGGEDVATEQALDGFFRLANNSWVAMPRALPTPRFRHAAVQYQEELWVGGGCVVAADGGHIVCDSIEVFSEDSGLWRKGPSMLRRREFFDLLVILGRLYAGDLTMLPKLQYLIAAVGGDADEHGNPALRTIEVLHDTDPMDEHWELVAKLPNARRGFSACAAGTKIYFLAGDSRNTDELDTNHSLSSWDAFDVLTR